MNYRPNPLLYGANEHFYGSFQLAILMRDEVDHDTLERCVAKAMTRYPYFCVYPVQQGNDILLCHNPRPVPVFADDRCVVLGSEESRGHLLTFGCKGRRIILNASHDIADGMGIDPLWKTVLCLYAAERYGEEGLQTEKIWMPGTPVAKEEYAYPFPEEAVEIDDFYLPKHAPGCAYALDGEAFDDGGLYAYHLHIPQKAMMAKANPSDGSPVSFLTVMLYRALCQLDPKIELPVVAHVQHQYRQALRPPATRHSMVSYVPVALPAKIKDWHVERQNTAVRGQILLGSEMAADLAAVNRLVTALPVGEGVSLSEKKQAMRQYIQNSLQPKTFGISYVGKSDWCGLDRYVEDMHVYIGEKDTRNMLLIEVMTAGNDFSVNFMQGGRGDRYVKAFIRQLRSFEIPVSMVGEERYTLCGTRIPG